MRANSLDIRKKQSPRTWAVLVGAVLALAGCGLEPGGDFEPPTSDKTTVAGLPHLDRDLRPGDRGEDVRAVQALLQKVGYFPNEALGRRYPAWRPFVSTAPGAGVYDTQTEAAVRAYQRMGGLPVTGVVDGPTRELLTQPRCGVPDSIKRPDRRDKFLLDDSAWSMSTITWRVHPSWNCPDISGENAEPVLNKAFKTWEKRTRLTFQKTTSNTPTIWFACQDLGDTLGTAFFPSDGPGNTIFFNNKLVFSTLPFPPKFAFDLRSVAVHEIGHALGLHHSSIGQTPQNTQPVMLFSGAPKGERRFNLTTDDTVAIGILYNPWQQLPGCAKDIGVNSTTEGTDIAWSIDCNNRPQKWNGSGWTLDTAGDRPNDAVSIAVQPNGQPWITRSNGVIMRKSSSSATSGSWQPHTTTCARDIAIGGDPDFLDVWAVGCAVPDGRVRRYDPDAEKFSDDVTDGGFIADGVRIAVGSDGRPWVINSLREIYRRTDRFPNSGYYQRQGDFPYGEDVGVYRGGDHVWAWVTTTFQLHVWNKQPQVGEAVWPDCSLGVVGKKGACFAGWWQWESGTAHRVSVGSCGAWVVTAEGNIFKRAECETFTTDR